MDAVRHSIHCFVFAILVAGLATGCSVATQAAPPATSQAVSTAFSQFSPTETLEVSPTARVEPDAAASPTPGISSTQVSSQDGMVMVFVPAGEFKMGGSSHSIDSLPSHVVDLDAFWIDKTEVTNAMFAKFIESSGYVTDAEKAGSSNEYRTTDEGDYFEEVRGSGWNHPHGEDSNISGLEDHPVVHVSWNDGNAYCSWAERRLPTEAEWEKAASFSASEGKKYVYSWGNSFDGNRLNFCDENCSLDYAIQFWDDGFAETSPVGSYPLGASPYGALDMAGNVMEWVADWYGENYYQNSPLVNPSGPESGENRVQRGGAWNTNDYYVSSSSRFGWEPSFTNGAAGFRCALSP